jgi:hypothetical protein
MIVKAVWNDRQDKLRKINISLTSAAWQDGDGFFHAMIAS